MAFPEHEGLELISAQRAIKEVEAGATCFMIVAHAEKNSTAENISVIPVVEEYAVCGGVLQDCKSLHSIH